MNTDWTVESLIAYENEIAERFNAGEVKAPVHLAGGNEAELIALFRDIQPCDWVMSDWRSHYHCLLKGVAADELTAAIVAGRSIGLAFPKYNVLCSGIVAGIAPIALGIAMVSRGERVHCFLGDMSAATGLAHECMKYAAAHDAPISWYIEDNGIGGAGVPTESVWGTPTARLNAVRYRYEQTVPFVGTGTHVRFV